MAPKVLGRQDGDYSITQTLEKKDKLYVPRKTFAITYLVLADDTTQTEEQILLATGIPALFYPLRGAYCKSRKGQEKETVIHPVTEAKTLLWAVTCEFDSDLDIDQDQPPESKEPNWRWTGENEEEVLERDAETGDPIQTAAEEPIILTSPVALPILEIERYEHWPFDPQVILDYVNHVNSAPFWGAPEGTALMLFPETDFKEIIEEEEYVKVKYRIKFKLKKVQGSFVPNSWWAKPLHHGFKVRPEAGKPPEIYKDKYGNPATVNLAPNGAKLPDGAEPDYLNFARFTKTDFNNLSLGPFS